MRDMKEELEALEVRIVDHRRALQELEQQRVALKDSGMTQEGLGDHGASSIPAQVGGGGAEEGGEIFEKGSALETVQKETVAVETSPSEVENKEISFAGVTTVLFSFALCAAVYC